MSDQPSSELIAMAASEFEALGVGLREPDDARYAIVFDGRHGIGQCEALFSKSAILDLADKNVHSQFLVFVANTETRAVFVRVVRDARVVAEYPSDTPVMVQWRGTYRSDYFHFLAGDLADFLRRRDEALSGESSK